VKIKLLKWKYKNIRSILDMKIDLTKNNKNYPVNMIMMPNGVGKTTTLILLRAILSGNAKNWNKEKILSFKPENHDVSNGYFKLDLNLDNEHYSIKLIFDYDNGVANYQTSRVSAGGISDGYNIKEDARRVLTEGFIKRFIFNGELAEEILESKSREAEKAIKFLYQLDVLETLQLKISNIIEERQKECEKTSTTTKIGLTRLENNKNGYFSALKNLKEKAENLNNKLNKKISRLEEVENDIDNRIKKDEGLKENFEKIENELKKNEIDLNDKLNRVFNLIRNKPFSFSKENLYGLKNISFKMKELKLPKTTSRQFFNELAEQPVCVCGREITENEKYVIKEKASEYLGDDQIGLINAIKTEIRNISDNNELEIEINELSNITSNKDKLTTEKQRIKTKKAEQGDIELEKLQDEESKLENDIEHLKNELEKLETTSQKTIHKYGLNDKNNIYLCQKEYDKIKEKYAEATGTIDLMYKAEKTKEYLENVKKLTLDKLKNKIKKETNERIAQIISTEEIIIENIDGYLKLKGKDGASEGQSLAIAYSFLGSLFEGSKHDLPFVVDSPAGSLDLDVGREVAKILPQLFKQLIIFITSRERKGFADEFYKISDNNIQYLVINKEKNKDAEVLKGKKFFQNYQDKTEED
jgi:hypothetical protein